MADRGKDQYPGNNDQGIGEQNMGNTECLGFQKMTFLIELYIF